MAAVVVCVMAAGCSPASPDPEPTATAPSTQISEAGDPLPNIQGPVVEIDEGGGSVEGNGVSVLVPAGSSQQSLQISFGEAAGIVDTGLTSERFGPPVQVEHDADLVKPLQVVWDVSQIDPLELATIGLAKWDDELQMWVSTPTDFTIDDGTLTASISDFSFWTWIANPAATITQVVGEFWGSRAAAPDCDPAPLPSWVNNVVRPDEDQDAIPIRTCVEADGDMVGVKVVNNRPYTQVVALNEGVLGSPTALEQDFTIAGLVRSAAATALSTDQKVIIPPTTGTRITLERPTEPGPSTRELAATPSSIGVGVDLLTYVLEKLVDKIGVQGFDAEHLNAAVQALYDCGGKQTLQTREIALNNGTVAEVAKTIAECADNDAVGLAIERSLRAQINKGGAASEAAVRTNRLLDQGLTFFSVASTVADFSSYTAELISSSALEPAKLTIFGQGQPQTLGGWTATCSNADTDSAALFVNLTSQDQFANTDKDYWQYDGWEPAARTAVEPLTACSTAHQLAVADNIDQTWGFPESATIVSNIIRTQAGGVGSGLPGLPDVLDGEWCAQSDPDECFSGVSLLAAWPDAFVEDSWEDTTLGTTVYSVCLAPISGSEGCGVVHSMYLEYFPAGIAWDCVSSNVETGDFPACDPDFTQQHDTSKARLVIPPNHQHNVDYTDTEPLYRTRS